MDMVNYGADAIFEVGDNLNLKVQDKVSQQQDVVNTRRIDNAVSEQVPTPKNLPAVRNLEPTFESMILDNTRTI